MNYSKYKQSRDLSWQILIDHNIVKLPVKVSQICRAMNIKLVKYSDGYKYIANFENHALNTDGFTFHNTIFYNDECSTGRQRFTVAHELGHNLLHDGKGSNSFSKPVEFDQFKFWKYQKSNQAMSVYEISAIPETRFFT